MNVSFNNRGENCKRNPATQEFICRPNADGVFDLPELVIGSKTPIVIQEIILRSTPYSEDLNKKLELLVNRNNRGFPTEPLTEKKWTWGVSSRCISGPFRLEVTFRLKRPGASRSIPRRTTSAVVRFEQPIRTAADVAVERKIFVEPELTEIRSAGEPSKLSVFVAKSVSGDQRPRLQVALNGNENLPPLLREHVSAALESELRSVESEDGRVDRWEANIGLRFSKQDEITIWRDQKSSGFPVVLQTTCGDAVVQHELLLTGGVEFPGWVAIDYGTSNSTVTVFDPEKVKGVRGLPLEQCERLRSRIETELEAGPSGIGNIEWRAFLNEIGKTIVTDGGQPIDTLLHPFRIGDQAQMHAVLRRLELALSNTPELRDAGNFWLYEIYEEVFRVPSMEDLNLAPVLLSPDNPDSVSQQEVSSEVEVASLAPLEVSMGETVRERRELAELDGRAGCFFRSLKPYLGQHRNELVKIADQTQRYSVERLVQGVWKHLLTRTGEYREKFPERFSPGRMTDIILTYPTVSPPSIRSEFEELARELGMTIVQTDYDEAISAAIFFLMRDYDLGTSMSIGMQAFKNRCRRISPDSNIWVQNILVLDVGGGTTDLALIRLTLEEKDPLADEPNGGARGRYYEMTPKLLGSTGHLQLGGQLISLHLFELLKVKCVDAILKASGGEGLEDRIATFGEPFLDEKGGYQHGSLTTRSLLSDEFRKEALLEADKILPTRWRSLPHEEEIPGCPVPSVEHRKAFNALWRHAEEAKIQLGGTTELYQVSWAEILEICESSLGLPSSVVPDLTITQDEFEFVSRPVIAEIVQLAAGLLRSRLPEYEEGDVLKQESLEWLIKTGKTCNMGLIDKELRRVLNDTEYFTWTRDRVTFDPIFAKQATSIGACYAEHLTRYAFAAEESVELLRKGRDQLEFRIRNLFFFLPCSFSRMVQHGEDPTWPIFNAGDELRQLDDQPVGKARTIGSGGRWGEPGSLQVTVLRKDYEDGIPQHWGTFNGVAIAKELGLDTERWRRSIRVQFEVDHRLKIRLYVCHGQPNYVVGTGRKSLNICQKIEPGAFAEKRDDGPNALALGVDIATHIQHAGGSYIEGDEQLIFAAGTPLNSRFYRDADDDQPVAGTVSETPLSGVHKDGLYRFYASPAGEREWTPLGSIEAPPKTDFPQQHFVTVDANGRLVVHGGEVPYMTVPTPQEMWERPGCVFAKDLDAVPRDLESERDPFSGTH